MTFNDPEQDAPRLQYPNDVRLSLPWAGHLADGIPRHQRLRVFLTGQSAALKELWPRLEPEPNSLLAKLA